MPIKFTFQRPAYPVSWPDTSRPLPVFVREYIEGGAAEGERNDTIFRCAQQFFACDYTQTEAEAWLMPRAVAQGGEKVRGEASKAIASAYRSTTVKEPLAKSFSATPRPRLNDSEPDMLRGLRAAFKPGERIAICPAFFSTDSQKWCPGKAIIHTLDEWAKRLPGVLDKSDGGCYIAINPVTKDAARRTRDTVAVNRHVLVEYDDPSLSLEEQERRLRDSGLPISVLVASGDRSIHAWVRVADDGETLAMDAWERRRDVLFERMNCDRKNKDVSRVSRLPGFMRGDKEQRLIATRIGAKGWHEWAKANGLENAHELPPIVSLRGFLLGDHEEPPEVVAGLLHKGCKMVLGAPSKARKSWALQDLALSVAAGWEWWGARTTKGRVLYINLEIREWAMQRRLSKLGESRGAALVLEAADNLEMWNLRGHAASIYDLVPRILKRIEHHGYLLVIIDPAYKLFGEMDENAAGDMNRFFVELERICSATGAALVVAHHFAKGNPHDKNPADRMSGSGVWTRDPDSLIVLTPPERERAKKGEKQAEPDDRTYTVNAILRNHPPCTVRTIRWMGAHYEPEGRVGTAREGSHASIYGESFSFMPKLRRDARDASKCELVRWAVDQFKITEEDAFNIINTIRQPRYQFIKHIGDSVYVGSRTEAPDDGDSEPY